MTTAAIYRRAVELDDDQPDDVCPGCGQNIDGWRGRPLHFRPDAVVSHATTWNHGPGGQARNPWPFTNRTNLHHPGVCTWDEDLLTARAHRRRLIVEGVDA